MSATHERTDRPLPAGWGWRTRREEDDPYPLRVLVSEQASAREWIAEAHGDGRWFVHESESEDATAEIAKGRATPRPGESLSAAAQRAAEAALWARDGFGVGEVYGARVEAWEMGHGDPGLLPGLPGRWTVTAVRPAEGGVEVDAVSAPDTQAEADAARAHVTGAADADRSQAEPASWNWCGGCKQAVDIDDDTHEGSRIRCLGCRAWHVVCRDGDGTWSLESEAEHDAEGEADDARGTAKDAPPLTHALDAEGNALCPYDPATLAYVSPRAERVTCPVCMEAVAEPAPREPSAPNLHDQIRAASFVAPVCSACGANVAHWIDIGKRSAACNGCGAVKDYGAETSAPDELARLLPFASEDADMVRSGRGGARIRRDAALRLARACELLLAERERVSAEKGRWKEATHKLASEADETIVTLRARVAELEAQIAPPRMAWTCTTCGVSGTTEMLADDGSGPVCPECRQARHLCMHEPAGHRVAALLNRLEYAADKGFV